jgi:hypothetical protein
VALNGGKPTSGAAQRVAQLLERRQPAAQGGAASGSGAMERTTRHCCFEAGKGARLVQGRYGRERRSGAARPLWVGHRS